MNYSCVSFMGHMGCVFASVLPVWGQDYSNDLFVNVTHQRNQLQPLQMHSYLHVKYKNI